MLLSEVPFRRWLAGEVRLGGGVFHFRRNPCSLYTVGGGKFTFPWEGGSANLHPDFVRTAQLFKDLKRMGRSALWKEGFILGGSPVLGRGFSESSLVTLVGGVLQILCISWGPQWRNYIGLHAVPIPWGAFYGESHFSGTLEGLFSR